MDINEIKQKLHSYKYINFKIDSINDKLIDLAATIDASRSIKLILLNGMPGSGNVSDPVADSVVRIVDIYSREYDNIKNELDKLFKDKRLIDNLISVLDSTENQIIELKYFKKYKWWMVAQTVHISDTHCRRICKNAIQKIFDSLKNK